MPFIRRIIFVMLAASGIVLMAPLEANSQTKEMSNGKFSASVTPPESSWGFVSSISKSGEEYIIINYRKRGKQGSGGKITFVVATAAGFGKINRGKLMEFESASKEQLDISLNFREKRTLKGVTGYQKTVVREELFSVSDKENEKYDARSRWIVIRGGAGSIDIFNSAAVRKMPDGSFAVLVSMIGWGGAVGDRDDLAKWMKNFSVNPR